MIFICLIKESSLFVMANILTKHEQVFKCFVDDQWYTSRMCSYPMLSLNYEANFSSHYIQKWDNTNIILKIDKNSFLDRQILFFTVVFNANCKFDNAIICLCLSNDIMNFQSHIHVQNDIFEVFIDRRYLPDYTRINFDYYFI